MNIKTSQDLVDLAKKEITTISAKDAKNLSEKGEITLTDLAQSESSLAGAKANLIKAKTELLSSKTNFERVTREKTPDLNNLSDKIFLILPNYILFLLNKAQNRSYIMTFFYDLLLYSNEF